MDAEHGCPVVRVCSCDIDMPLGVLHTPCASLIVSWLHWSIAIYFLFFLFMCVSQGICYASKVLRAAPPKCILFCYWWIEKQLDPPAKALMILGPEAGRSSFIPVVVLTSHICFCFSEIFFLQFPGLTYIPKENPLEGSQYNVFLYLVQWIHLGYKNATGH